MAQSPTHRHPNGPCAHCGQDLDVSLSVREDDLPPRPGDFTLCARCGALHRFGDDLAPRMATPEEFLGLLASRNGPTLRRAIEFIQSGAAERQLHPERFN